MALRPPVNRLTWTVAATLACFAFMGGTAMSQVTAKSEAPPEDLGKEFRSPMVLSLPVPAVLNVKRPEAEDRIYQIALQGLQGYECDGVVLKSVTGKAKTRGMSGNSDLEIVITMTVQPGIDKLVNVRAELLVNDQAISADYLHPIDAEERKKATAKLALPFRNNTLQDGVAPVLRLTITVADNP